MITLTTPQIAALVQKHFGDLGPQVVADMTATFLAESGGQSVVGAQNKDGSYDRGIPQINDVHGYDKQRLIDDPAYAMQAARQVYDQQGIGAWSAWNAGTALDHWDEAAQAVTGLYGQPPATTTAALKPAYKQAIGATIAQSGAGSSPVATAAPQTVNTGEDITKLYYWVLQQLQQLGTGASETTGMYPSELAGGAKGAWSPTQAKQQWDQTYQAQRDDANRNYALNLQRFGLDYANTAFNQQVAAADAQRANLALEVSKQGPADWLKYNYILNNRPAPPSPTATGTVPGVPQPNVSGGVSNGVPSGPTGSALQLQGDQAKAKALSDAYNSGDVGQYRALGGTASDARVGAYGGAAQPAEQQSNVTATVGPPSPTPPDASGRDAAQISADNAQTMAAYGNIPQLAFGGESVPLEGDVLEPGEDAGPPPPPGGGFIEWLHRLYEADMASHGGATGGGMNAAIVGDPQSARNQPDANPELVTSLAPFNVQPLNKMGLGAREATRALPHKATGGLVFGNQEAMDAPFVQNQIGGRTASFGARGEDLGVYGKQPLSYANWLQQLPSEQAMTQGLIETPTAQGGYGGYFPDELERSRRSAFTGPRDLPYRQTAAVGYEA